MNRRGVTLAECAVALATGAVVLAALHLLLLAATRAREREAARREARGTVRAAAAILRSELQGVAASAGDLVALDDTALSVRAVRAHGSACTQPAPDRLVVGAGSWSALRAADPARDVARVFLDGDPDDPADDAWWVAPIAATRSGSCPDGSAGILLTLAQASPSAVAVGAPVRLLETVEYRLYADATGQRWLGTRTRSVSGWTVTSPLVGPLRAGDGLHVDAVDSSGAAAASPAKAVLMVLTMHARSSRLMPRAGGVRSPAEDSLRFAVAVGP